MRIVKNHIGHAEIMGDDDEVVGLVQNHLGHAEIYSGSDVGWNPFKKIGRGVRSAGRFVSRHKGKIAAPMALLSVAPSAVVDVARGKKPWKKRTFTRHALRNVKRMWGR